MIQSDFTSDRSCCCIGESSFRKSSYKGLGVRELGFHSMSDGFGSDAEPHSIFFEGVCCIFASSAGHVFNLSMTL